MVSSSVAILLPLAVTVADLRDDLRFGQSSARQIEVQQFGDVSGAEQRDFVACFEPRLDGEQQRQAGEADVMMPSFPYPYLVLRHSDLAFRLMKRMLDPVTLALDPREPLP